MTNKMETKAIEFTIPCHQLCEFENVKNLTRIDGSEKTFIEKSAYLSLLAEAETLAKHLSLETGGYESAYCKHPGQCRKDAYDCLADDRVIALQEFAAFKKEMGIK